MPFSQPDIRIHPDLAALSTAAAELMIQAASQAIETRDRFSLCLSGGNTPRALYTLLSQPGYRQRIDWQKVDIFWGDERCVPPDHPDSDYGMAYHALLSHLAKGAQPVIYRLEGELDPQTAADRYESILHTYFGARPETSFDLLLLGMGEDGHTASLFPGTLPIQETERWVCAHFVPKLATNRLTLTPPILNLARRVIFLAAGQNKATVLKDVLFGQQDPDLLPSQSIQPHSGDLIWLIDKEAASALP